MKQKKIKLPALNPEEYAHMLAALHFLQSEWDSHGAYAALRRDTEVPFLRGTYDDLVRRIEQAGSVKQ